MILDAHEPPYNPNKSEGWQCGAQDGFWHEVERAARYQAIYAGTQRVGTVRLTDH